MNNACPICEEIPWPERARTPRNKAPSADQEPGSTATAEKETDQKPGPKGRTPGGQFAAGNAGGPGNPHARACARMLQAFRDNITEEEMLQICRMLFVKAVGGDISAAKIILSYKIGKPLPAPHPDSIDRDEWDHYQSDAIREQEMKRVMTSLPTQAGNDIVRVSLPIMTAGRMNDFAAELLEGLPRKKDEGGGMKEEGKTETGAPIANGKSGRGDAERGEGREKKGTRTNTAETPIPNGKLNGNDRQSSAKSQPIANGKKNRTPERKPANRATTSASAAPPAGHQKESNTRKKIRPPWTKPLAAQLQGK